MFIALCAGGPILMDEPVYEPYFHFSNFRVFFNAGQWEDVDRILSTLNADRWAEIRRHNQKAFDRYLSPSAIGNYLIGEIERSMRGETTPSDMAHLSVPSHQDTEWAFQQHISR